MVITFTCLFYFLKCDCHITYNCVCIDHIYFHCTGMHHSAKRAAERVEVECKVKRKDVKPACDHWKGRACGKMSEDLTNWAQFP